MPRTIPDGKARRIAAEWQSSEACPTVATGRFRGASRIPIGFNALSHAGAIIPSLADEIADSMLSVVVAKSKGWRTALHELRQLRRYAQVRGLRGSVLGWGDVRFIDGYINPPRPE